MVKYICHTLYFPRKNDWQRCLEYIAGAQNVNSERPQLLS